MKSASHREKRCGRGSSSVRNVGSQVRGDRDWKAEGSGTKGEEERIVNGLSLCFVRRQELWRRMALCTAERSEGTYCHRAGHSRKLKVADFTVSGFITV